MFDFEYHLLVFLMCFVLQSVFALGFGVSFANEFSSQSAGRFDTACRRFSCHHVDMSSRSFCSYRCSTIWNVFGAYRTTSIGKSTSAALILVESNARHPTLNACCMESSYVSVRSSIGFPYPVEPMTWYGVPVPVSTQFPSEYTRYSLWVGSPRICPPTSALMLKDRPASSRDGLSSSDTLRT